MNEPNPTQSFDPVVSIVSFQCRGDYVDECFPVRYASSICRKANVICKPRLLEDRGGEKPELKEISSVTQLRRTEMNEVTCFSFPAPIIKKPSWQGKTWYGTMEGCAVPCREASCPAMR